jgi:hypothetical protein
MERHAGLLDAMQQMLRTGVFWRQFTTPLKILGVSSFPRAARTLPDIARSKRLLFSSSVTNDFVGYGAPFAFFIKQSCQMVWRQCSW